MCHKFMRASVRQSGEPDISERESIERDRREDYRRVHSLKNALSLIVPGLGQYNLHFLMKDEEPSFLKGPFDCLSYMMAQGGISAMQAIIPYTACFIVFN